MATLGLQLQPPTLDNPQCWPAAPQTLINEAFSKGRGLLGSITGIILAATAPAATDRDKAWLKVVGGHVIGVFGWDSVLNAWLYPNPEPPNSSAVNIGPVRWWKGDVASLVTYDGGEVGAVSAISGPMWEVDADFVGRSPIGPGLIPGTATTLAVGATGGEGLHTLTIAELAAHTHEITRNGLDLTSGDLLPPQAAASNFVGGGTHANMTTESTGLATPFNVVHPVVAVYAIKRTARGYYRG